MANLPIKLARCATVCCREADVAAVGTPTIPANYVTPRADLRNLREKEQQGCQNPLIRR